MSSQNIRQSASPREPYSRGRSGARAAVLSSIFPGLGQAYLRHRRAALTFALPVLALLLVLVIYVISSGITRAGVKLLDPTIALVAAIIVVLLGIWWISAVVGAWRSGQKASRAILVPLVLVLIIGVATAYGASWMWRLSVADRGLYNGQDPTTAVVTPGPSPSPTPTLAPGQTIDPNATPTPTPTIPPDVAIDTPDPNEPPPSIIPGTPPPIDITKLDATADGWLNVLIIGIDKTVDRNVLTGARSDTMIVVSTNTASGGVYMFSFPRDTAQFPLYTGGTYGGKLNTFAGHTKGDPTFNGGGQPALAYEIGFLLGMPIDYYASVNMDGFQALVDQVGGVTICNQHDIADDQMGFYLSPGLHTLNGADALRYARSRHGMGGGDFARARRQQQLLTAIRAQILKPENLARLPDIVSSLAGVVGTNFPPGQIDLLVTLANQVQAEPTAQYVFQFPEWAIHPPAGDTNGRSLQFLRLDKIGTLSQQIFGDKSLYWTGQPVPTLAPEPSPTPSTPDAQC